MKSAACPGSLWLGISEKGGFWGSSSWLGGSAAASLNASLDASWEASGTAAPAGSLRAASKESAGFGGGRVNSPDPASSRHGRSMAMGWDGDGVSREGGHGGRPVGGAPEGGSFGGSCVGGHGGRPEGGSFEGSCVSGHGGAPEAEALEDPMRAAPGRSRAKMAELWGAGRAAEWSWEPSARKGRRAEGLGRRERLLERG